MIGVYALSVSPSYSFDLQSIMIPIINQVIADMVAMIKPYGSIMVISLSVYLGLNFFKFSVENILPYHSLNDDERAAAMMQDYQSIADEARYEDSISEVILTNPDFAASYFGSRENASDYVDHLFSESRRLDGVRRADLEEDLFLDRWRSASREMKDRYEFMDVLRADPEMVDEFFGSSAEARQSMRDLFDDDLVLRRMARNPDYEPHYK